MSETYVSRTVSLRLKQIQWLSERYGNVSKGIQQVIEQAQRSKKIDLNTIGALKSATKEKMK